MMQYADIYSPSREIGSPTFVFTDNEGVVQYFKAGTPSPTYSLPPMLEMIEYALKAENIAIGQGDNFLEEAAFTAWEEENENYAGQGHRRNMLKSSYTSVGVAHVIYKGWHYWVQEFSDKVVGDVKIEANDSPAKVKMSILKYYLNGRELIPVEDSITMKVGEKKPMPEIHLSIKTYGTFNVSNQRPCFGDFRTG